MMQNEYIDGWVRVDKSRFTPSQLQQILFKLTYKTNDGKVIPAYRVEGSTVLLPWEYANRFFIEDRRVSGNTLSCSKINSFFKYRDGQEESVNYMFNFLKENNSGILQAKPGVGKTIIGSVLAVLFGRSTCVLVHKEFLYEQWVRAFKLVCPELKVGLLQRDHIDTGEDCDIVCAITQSVTNSKRKYTDSFYSSFGLIVVDELHRYSSEMWGKAITKFPAKYRLGLTATPFRTDGLWPIIEHHFGKVSYVSKSEELKPKVYVVETGTEFSRSSYDFKYLTTIQKKAKLLSLLSKDDKRNSLIARHIEKAFKAGRKSLVISDRRKQLDILSKMVKSSIEDTNIGFYVGGKKQSLLNLESKKEVIFATYKMAVEGLDIPELDVLILATPRAQTTQVVGRIVRQLQGKKQPVVVDFIDGSFELKNLALSRLRQYKEAGYTVIRG